jgi:hypothetical protein
MVEILATWGPNSRDPRGNTKRRRSVLSKIETRANATIVSIRRQEGRKTCPNNLAFIGTITSRDIYRSLIVLNKDVIYHPATPMALKPNTIGDNSMDMP